MRKTILYIWQLGVNVIGLPNLLKVTDTKENFILVGKGRNKDLIITKHTVKYE